MRGASRRVVVGRGFLAAVLVLAGGCAADEGGDGSPSGGAPPAELAVHVSLAPTGLSVVSVTPTSRTSPMPFVGSAAIAYTFTDSHGAVVQTGRVPDPRPVFAEDFASGEGQRVDGQHPYASIIFHLHAGRGTLALREDAPGGADLGSVQVVPPAHSAPPGTAASALVNTATDIVGDPVEVVAHGSAANSFDLLFLPEGFQQADLPRFASDVQRVVDHLASRPDFGAHWDKVNVWRIDVLSRDSGVGAMDTAFQLTRDPTTDRLLIFGDSRGPAAAAELGARVGADQVFIIANTTYGGSGGTLAVAGDDASLPQVVAHELGHSLVSLADEYDYGWNDAQCTAPGTPTFGSASVNVSVSSDRSALPWADLVDPSTPLPTPTGMTELGAYQGGGYCTAHRYRPTPDCLMRELSQPMCPVCQRALDAFFARFPGGGPVASTGGGSSGDPDAGAPGSGTAPAPSSCEHSCADYGYTSGQCVSGWYCDGSCVTFTGCTDSGDPAPSMTSSGDDGGASGDDDASAGCEHTCADYGYASGQCVSGWYCDGVCIVYNGCGE